MKYLNGLLLLTVLFVLVGCQKQKEKDYSQIPMIDTHIHFYDTSRPGGVPWPKPDDKPLYKPTLPKHFKPVTQTNGIAATVIVEASDLNKDNKWLLDVTKNEKSQYTGIVGNLSVGSPMFKKQLDELCQDPRFVGLRIRPRKDQQYFTDKFWKDLEYLASKGKTLDVLMVKITLPEVVVIAKRIPNLKIMINHLSGLSLDQPNVVNATWKKQIEACAAQPNIYCKISGLFQRGNVKPVRLDLDYYKACLDHIVASFDEDHLVYGSNWPVLNRYGTYEEYKALIMDFCNQYDRKFVEKLLYKNAIKFYGLPELN